LLAFAQNLAMYTSAPANFDQQDLTRPWHLPFPDENTMSMGRLRNKHIESDENV
jgi:hypothetical protein